MSDGTLDTTFSGDGKVITDFTPVGGARGAAVVLQSDGKLVAAGSAGYGDIGYAEQLFALARYNPDGTLDVTFSDDGRTTTNLKPRYVSAGGLDLQADGKIVAAGAAGRRFALTRYNADGTLDRTFSGNGKVIAPFGSEGGVSAVAFQADGKIVAAGGASDWQVFALARYNPDGTVDATFGENGITTTDITPCGDYASGIAIQADGKIVAAGSGCSSSFAVARYLPAGTPDTSFSEDGITTTDFTGFEGYYDVAYAVAIQGDGKIVAGGAAGGYLFALARYLGS
jgi:uncharacterized delta-60 repeat protein